jgi:hypothetical protein
MLITSAFYLVMDIYQIFLLLYMQILKRKKKIIHGLPFSLAMHYKVICIQR